MGGVGEQTAKKKRVFKKYKYRGVDLDQLLDMDRKQLGELMNARARRNLRRAEQKSLAISCKRKRDKLLKKLQNAKKEAEPGEKPKAVRTHLRNVIIVPEMVGCVVAVYNGKTFIAVEIKAEMIGHYLGEFSITYKPVTHGRPGIGATHSSRFIPLK